MSKKTPEELGAMTPEQFEAYLASERAAREAAAPKPATTSPSSTRQASAPSQPSGRQVEYDALFATNVAAGMPIVRAKAVAKTTVALVHDELPSLTEDEFIALPTDLARELTSLTEGDIGRVIADAPEGELRPGIDRDFTEDESKAIIAKYEAEHPSREASQRARQLADARQAAVNGLVSSGVPQDEAVRVAGTIADDVLVPPVAAKGTQPELDALAGMPREAFGLQSRD